MDRVHTNQTGPQDGPGRTGARTAKAEKKTGRSSKPVRMGRTGSVSPLGRAGQDGWDPRRAGQDGWDPGWVCRTGPQDGSAGRTQDGWDPGWVCRMGPQDGSAGRGTPDGSAGRVRRTGGTPDRRTGGTPDGSAGRVRRTGGTPDGVCRTGPQDGWDPGQAGQDGWDPRRTGGTPDGSAGRVGPRTGPQDGRDPGRDRRTGGTPDGSAGRAGPPQDGRDPRRGQDGWDPGRVRSLGPETPLSAAWALLAHTASRGEPPIFRVSRPWTGQLVRCENVLRFPKKQRKASLDRDVAEIHS